MIPFVHLCRLDPKRTLLLQTVPRSSTDLVKISHTVFKVSVTIFFFLLFLVFRFCFCFLLFCFFIFFYLSLLLAFNGDVTLIVCVSLWLSFCHLLLFFWCSEGGKLVKLQDELVTYFIAEQVLNATTSAWTGKGLHSSHALLQCETAKNCNITGADWSNNFRKLIYSIFVSKFRLFLLKKNSKCWDFYPNIPRKAGYGNTTIYHDHWTLLVHSKYSWEHKNDW